MGGPLGGILQGLQNLDNGGIYLIIAELIVLVLLLLIAFPVHELAHAITARWLGDDTAERLGRITLNPLKHLDPMGTILFVLTGFGWAKPVPVNLYRLNGNSRTSFAIVALAGPVSNLILAAIFAVLYRILVPSLGDTDAGQVMAFALRTAVSLNIILALFNLIPIPPLDGSRLLTAILPDQGQAIMDQLERFGFLLVLVLSVTGVLGTLIVRPAADLTNLMLRM
jgi:Zn-dependent protease